MNVHQREPEEHSQVSAHFSQKTFRRVSNLTSFNLYVAFEVHFQVIRSLTVRLNDWISKEYFHLGAGCCTRRIVPDVIRI